MTQLNSYFGNLAQCKNHSALLIRSLKNVWKKKLIFVKLKCISKVTFPISHEQERQSKKAAIISLQEHRWPHTDSSSCLIAVISEWGIPRASLVPSPSNITPHCTTVNWTLHCTLHCSVEQLELSSSWWLRDSSENSSRNPGMSRTVSASGWIPPQKTQRISSRQATWLSKESQQKISSDLPYLTPLYVSFTILMY